MRGGQQFNKVQNNSLKQGGWFFLEEQGCNGHIRPTAKQWCTCIPASTPVLLNQQVQAEISTTSTSKCLDFTSKVVSLQISK